MSTDLPLVSPDEEFNPFAPPSTAIGEPPVDLVPGADLARAEAIRQAHIGHEAAIKSIGSLHFLGAIIVFFAVGGVVAFFALSDRFVGVPNSQRLTIGIVCAFYLLLSILYLALGIGLIRLQRWARWTDVVLISLSMLVILIQIGLAVLMHETPTLIGASVGAVISGYMLYLLLASKASVIFSPEYKAIIAQTPHIKYRTSPLVKLILVMILVLFALGFLSLVLG